MVNVLIVTQGRLADELLSAAERIAGPRAHMNALSMEWEDSVEKERELVRGEIERLADGEGLLILTDVFGGTPYNLATAHFEPGRIEVLAGVNLPIVMRLACNKNANRPLPELAEWVERKGRESICLGGLPEKPKESCRPEAEAVVGSSDGRS
jgi:PTS system mannose-specific IIA component